MNAVNIPKIGNNCLNLNGTIFKTSGNIIFSEDKEARYHNGESDAMKRIDKAIEKGILSNGMRDLVEKFKRPA